MSILSPKLASELAESVYEFVKPKTSFGHEEGFGTSYIQKHFEFNRKGIGQTGGYFINKKTGFAAMGTGKGQYSGDAIVAIRGTYLPSLADWGTNLQLALHTADNNQPVHAGFQRAFSSLKPQFQQFLNQWCTNHPGKAVHCVGHSLGGALATLTADWISSRYTKNVNLYTFGAPRVGQLGFALKNTTKVPNNYRCTHGADLVPKVPLWPFFHSPYKGFEYRLDRSQGLSMEAHGMSPLEGGNPGYLVSANCEDWSSLQRKSNEYLQPVRLKYEDRNQASFSDYWSERLSAALITLLRETRYYAAVAVQATISAGATFYDLVARTLETIAKTATKAADQVKGLLGHMLAFAGSAVTLVADLTYHTIRAIFNKMLKRLYAGVREALKWVHKQ
ncbi:lipase family protein [Shewanella sp. Scap07]|uniref:lipase family protein n=1 Tax=Shewanella sp. Scap07 TaxID=2589987 RepID=UPI0015BDCD7A|nr:lipase family protein [Shewanella sp. Scap07]QLE87148.1 lipase family protein [Shewanella sp. Scap07]